MPFLISNGEFGYADPSSRLVGRGVRFFVVVGLLWFTVGSELRRFLNGGCKVIGLGRQMTVHAANHRRVTMPHQLGNCGDLYPIQNRVRSECVTEFIGANTPQTQLFAQAFHLQADCIRRPRIAVTVDENKLGLSNYGAESA